MEGDEGWNGIGAECMQEAGVQRWKRNKKM